MPALLDRISVVLVEPQDALNIGGVLRALANMGIEDLRLVNPVERDPERIGITAPGLESRAATLPVYSSLKQALADGVLALGFTARTRRAPREVRLLDELGVLLEERLPRGSAKCHLVFGREDFGLSNEDLDRCHGVVTIPTSPAHHSLNLAQAVLLAAYTVRRAALEWKEPRSVRTGDDPATSEELEGLMGQIETALAFIEFFKFPGASTSVMRTLRVLLSRARPRRREVQTVRGVFAEVVAFCRRRGIPGPDER